MKFSVNHLNRHIPPEAHTCMYVWHKYWSRKTWNVVGEYIKAYCPEGGIVLDPFAGSGVTAMEALKNGRRAIVCDLVPTASEITRLTIKPCSEIELFEAYLRVKQKVKEKIEKLYITTCRNCHKKLVFNCAVWRDNKYSEIRYHSCPFCGDRRDANCSPNKVDENLISSIKNIEISDWYPTNPLYYQDNRPFKEKQQYESVDELFTKRNLQALAWLIGAIEEESNRTLRDFLKAAFSSMVHLCSRMNAISNPSPTSHHTAFSSTGWTQHSYWYAMNYMEQNVWKKFDSAVNGPQGLLKAKAESNTYFKDVKIASSLNKFFSNKADVYIYNGSCFDLMKRLSPKSVDYIFTDPPYDASIQFGELSYMWTSWLKMDSNYLEKIVANEVVRNERQHKDFNIYYALLSRSFQNMFEVLKPGHFLTLTFHNPAFKVRNSTIRAGVFAGFEFEKIFHQPLGQTSAKSMLQPFGSAQGDFYLRFRKPRLKVSKKPLQTDEVRFENIVVETTIKLLAERAEPTPYTIIINYIDPILTKHGFFGSLPSGLDVNGVLRKHLENEFTLLPAKVGGAEGKLWWFKNTSIVPHLNEVPLTERVEQTVYRKLLQMGRVTFTEMWDAVSTEFPNSLTSDSTSIKSALEIYARKVSGGFWLIKPEIRHRVNQHNEIIVILARIGKKQGFNIWIGKREQSETDSGIVAKGKKLRDYMDIDRLKVTNATNQDVIENIDVIWIKRDKIKSLFEVESTTTMTSALLRGSNVKMEVEKFMILPEERDGQFRNKFSSPLFKQHFENENWRLIYFDTLRRAYSSKKTEVDIYSLIGKKTKEIKTRKSKDTSSQRRLF